MHLLTIASVAFLSLVQRSSALESPKEAVALHCRIQAISLETTHDLFSRHSTHHSDGHHDQIRQKASHAHAANVTQHP
jgi:hypothetical protein